ISLYLLCCRLQLPLSSFPTRRSSDLIFQFPLYWYSAPAILKQWLDEVWNSQLTSSHLLKGRELGIVTTVAHSASAFQPGASQGRSEEHTSELQSRFDIVCRLLLENKK